MNTIKSLSAGLLLGTSALFSWGAQPSPGSVLPYGDTTPAVELQLEVEDSTASWPQRVSAPAGAPNVLLIMTDDEGFAANSVYGGPIPRPTLEQLASNGLRYNQFHTAAICSPSRAALLTGRNPHAVRSGNVVDIATPFPGYWSNIPNSAAGIARILRDNGYNTAMFGKDHNVPPWERSAAGPFDRWPTGMGFEYFFGFVGGDSDQWHPGLFRNTYRLKENPVPTGETLDHAFASDAIAWLHQQQAAHSGKPFFLYYAPGTPHAPHQVPKSWIAKFKGQFDGGWDKQREQTFDRQKAIGIIPQDAVLTPRPEQIPAWDSLTAQQQTAYARMMEVYAATVAYQDAQLGRVLEEIKRMGQLDNTLVLVISGDNGASGEGGPGGTSNELGEITNQVHDSAEWLAASMDDMGGPRSYQNYPVGWAWAMNTPFPWTKQVASHLGGSRNGLVVSWPLKINSGAVRTQFASLVDIVPTILEAANIAAPTVVDGVAQQPLNGTSLAYSFADGSAPGQHNLQYFESQGNRAIYHYGWWANTIPERMPWESKSPAGKVGDYQWQLYNLNQDYSQSKNLAAQQPQKLAQLQALWLQEAKANGVLPIDDRFGFERAQAMIHWLASGRDHFTYWAAGIQVEQSASPSWAGRGFSIEAQLELPGAKTSGVVLAMGSWFGGWSFYLKNNVPMVQVAASTKPEDQFHVAADKPLPKGEVTLRFEFAPDKPGLYQPGVVTIYANGKAIGSGAIGRTIARMAGLSETFDIGFDSGTPVTSDYQNQGRFEGDIKRVDVSLKPVQR